MSTICTQPSASTAVVVFAIAFMLAAARMPREPTKPRSGGIAGSNEDILAEDRWRVASPSETTNCPVVNPRGALHSHLGLPTSASEGLGD